MQIQNPVTVRSQDVVQIRIRIGVALVLVNQNANVMKVILEVLTDDVFIHGTVTQMFNVRMVNTLTNVLASAMSFIAVQIPDVPSHGKIFAINQ